MNWYAIHDCVDYNSSNIENGKSSLTKEYFSLSKLDLHKLHPHLNLDNSKIKFDETTENKMKSNLYNFYTSHYLEGKLRKKWV